MELAAVAGGAVPRTDLGVVDRADGIWLLAQRPVTRCTAGPCTAL